MAEPIDPETVIVKLQEAAKKNVAIDTKRVKKAFTKHFKLLGLEAPPLVVAPDYPTAWLEVIKGGPRRSQEWNRARDRVAEEGGIARDEASATDDQKKKWTVAATKAAAKVKAAAKPSAKEKEAWAGALKSAAEETGTDRSAANVSFFAERSPWWIGTCLANFVGWRTLDLDEPAYKLASAIWEPFEDACDAGLTRFWISEQQILALGWPQD